MSLNEQKLQETIDRAKAAFYERERECILSEVEFLYQQGTYIQKHWWLLQGLLLLGVWGLLRVADAGWYQQRCMGIAASLFAVLLMPELWKSRAANAMELECTTYYSLRQVYAARLLLFGAADAVLLTLFLVGATMTAGVSAVELMIQFLLPFTVTCCICFRTLYSKVLNSELMALLLCMIWTVVWVQIVLNRRVYDAISVPMWGGLMVLAVVYLAWCIGRGQRQCEENWEGKLLWN